MWFICAAVATLTYTYCLHFDLLFTSVELDPTIRYRFSIYASLLFFIMAFQLMNFKLQSRFMKNFILSYFEVAIKPDCSFGLCNIKCSL